MRRRCAVWNVELRLFLVLVKIPLPRQITLCTLHQRNMFHSNRPPHLSVLWFETTPSKQHTEWTDPSKANNAHWPQADCCGADAMNDAFVDRRFTALRTHALNLLLNELRIVTATPTTTLSTASFNLSQPHWRLPNAFSPKNAHRTM